MYRKGSFHCTGDDRCPTTSERTIFLHALIGVLYVSRVLVFSCLREVSGSWIGMVYSCAYAWGFHCASPVVSQFLAAAAAATCSSRAQSSALLPKTWRPAAQGHTADAKASMYTTHLLICCCTWCSLSCKASWLVGKSSTSISSCLLTPVGHQRISFTGNLVSIIAQSLLAQLPGSSDILSSILFCISSKDFSSWSHVTLRFFMTAIRLKRISVLA